MRPGREQQVLIVLMVHISIVESTHLVKLVDVLLFCCDVTPGGLGGLRIR